ncbi:MAG: hypothetical protein KJ583_00780 [Nanoarchaeota archaeon]|nr:hypothetical protein [Nanoarchaeota archaeon]MBU1269612.1 hypothetical protein [Nanoarchaeota archaeon]MBU1603824.1 hypothetical protein [Nanoarchaeota archaeon]MBU2443256.1 hypothetical protein [Nanoarchaeota archaeon]
MKKYWLALIFLLMLLPLVHAQEVKVGVYVLNLGKFDIATGAFTADFYLDFQCEEECSPENFEFMNGRSTSVDKIIDEPTEKFYRVQANLNSQVDLRRFPFDKQEMVIIIEDKRNTIEDIKYVANEEESGIDPSVIFTGWRIDGWTAKTTEHVYDVYDETYSQYRFTINISKIFFNSFIKTFLPVMFIILILLFSFVLDPDKITTRLTMATSSLIAAVMFHISISNQIPPVGYLTIADQFMLLTYFIILATIFFNVTLLELSERKNSDRVEKIHRFAEFSVFLIVPLIYLIWFIIIFLV